MLFDWLFPREAQRRDERIVRAAVLEREARDLIDDLQGQIKALQATADEERLGYPLANALKRRRPRDE